MLITGRHHAWVCLLGVAGCVSFPLPLRTGVPETLTTPLAHYYDYLYLPLKVTEESTQIRSGYSLHKLRLSGTEKIKPIRIDWYKPNRPGCHPVVLMSPILAGNDLYVREFAAFYAARGLHAVIVYRQKEIFSADRPLQDVETHLRETVVELRRVIDWMETEPSIDSQRVGTFSISLGAILTSVLAAVEPRVRCSVLGLPAGHLPEVIITSQDKSIRKRRKSYLEKQGWSRSQALEELKKVVVTEPMNFAGAVNPRKILIIAGLFDRVLGFRRSLALWRAMGRPRLILLPTGHYTAYLATPYLKLATYSFLFRELNSSSRST